MTGLGGADGGIDVAPRASSLSIAVLHVAAGLYPRSCADASTPITPAKRHSTKTARSRLIRISAPRHSSVPVSAQSMHSPWRRRQAQTVADLWSENLSA